MSKGGYRPNSGRKKGSIPWNKGVKSGNHGNGFQKGQVAWNKGLPLSEETKLKMSHSLKGRPSPWKGKSPSHETRLKMSLAKKGKPSKKKGKPMSEAQKLKIGEAHYGRPKSEIEKLLNRQGQTNRYLKLNPNYVVSTRNKRISDNGGFHSNKEWETLKVKYNYTCPCCKKQEPNITLTRDHIVPLLMGGSNDIKNIQPLCKQCNTKKHTQTIRYDLIICPPTSM